MPCLAAVPPIVRPGRWRPSTSVRRRGRTLAALPCGCRCGRRHLIGASSAATLLPLLAPPSPAAPPIDPEVMLERAHPSRPDWYEEFYATAMDQGMKSYEAEIAGYKAKLFSQLSAAGKNILELGVGTGPNFKYYASDDGVNVIGVDPNKHMEAYARSAAVSAGLPPSSFTFKRGVAEALPAEDCSMDVVISTLVLCSVNNVDMALREIYSLKAWRVSICSLSMLPHQMVRCSDSYRVPSIHCSNSLLRDATSLGKLEKTSEM